MLRLIGEIIGALIVCAFVISCISAGQSAEGFFKNFYYEFFDPAPRRKYDPLSILPHDE